MTDRKLVLQEQARRAVRAVEPDGRPTVVLLAVNGPRPWLMGMFGMIGVFLLKTYFITLTKQSVIIHRGPRSSPQPAELLHVIPRGEAAGMISDVKLGVTWSSLRFKFPGASGSTRLNVSGSSRPELDQFVAALKKEPRKV